MDFLYTVFIIVYIFYKLHFVFFKVIYEYRKPAYIRKDKKDSGTTSEFNKVNNLISGQQASVLLFRVLNYFCSIESERSLLILDSYLKKSSVTGEISKRYRHIKQRFKLQDERRVERVFQGFD